MIVLVRKLLNFSKLKLWVCQIIVLKPGLFDATLQKKRLGKIHIMHFLY